MSDDVPPIEVTSETGTVSAFDFERLEAVLLALGNENKALIVNEKRQRYLIRWIAIAFGIVVIVAMLVIFWHLTHKLFWGPFLFAGSAVGVAIIVAPIVSITAITVAIFVAAFRRFDDSDLEKIGSSASGAASIFNQS